MKYKIYSLGDNALTVEFGNEINLDLNSRALNLADFLNENPFPGFIETVPAYASLTVFYDVSIVRRNYRNFSTAFEAIENLMRNALENSAETKKPKSRLIEIPVCFDAEFALDLEFVAATANLQESRVKEIFLSKTYRVFMLGFLPGFSYMGEVDERIAAPRKSAPRLKVPRGSVGIAGRQTGIYSLESPGGWQIIGRTDFELFTPNDASPTALRAGDSVKFYEISKEKMWKNLQK